MNTRKYMTIRVLIAVLLFACSLPAQQQEQKKDEKPAFQLETLYMAIMSKAEPFDAKRAAQISADEQKYWQSVADTGTLILGGPTPSEEKMAAVFVLRVADKEAALKITNADPLVAQKLWKVALLPWGTQ